jgi:hypothetical protein
MKRTVATIAFILISLICGCKKPVMVTTQPVSLELIGDKRSFTTAEYVALKISNVTESKAFYVVGLETLVDDKWDEYLPDATRPFEGGVMISVLQASNAVTLKWPNISTETVKSPILRKRIVLRFAVSYADNLPPNHEAMINMPKTYSEKFEFNGGKSPFER